MPKVSIIGAGRVGSTAAYAIASIGAADVVLVDVVDGLPQGTALDMMQSAPVTGMVATITGTCEPADIAGSDVVVIAAGFPRSPGMTREDLLAKNGAIVLSAVGHLMKYAPEAVLIVVTNPLDLMVCLALKAGGLAGSMVMGMGGALDSARMSYFMADELGEPIGNMRGLVIGSHGDSMVPLPRFSRVGDMWLTDVADQETIDRIVARTIGGGAEIVSLLKQGSAFYAPGACIATMVEAILDDHGTVTPCSVYLEGEFGLSGLCIGVPAILGRGGLCEVVDLNLDETEAAAMARSADEIRAGLPAVEGLALEYSGDIE